MKRVLKKVVFLVLMLFFAFNFGAYGLEVEVSSAFTSRTGQNYQSDDTAQLGVVAGQVSAVAPFGTRTGWSLYPAGACDATNTTCGNGVIYGTSDTAGACADFIFHDLDYLEIDPNASVYTGGRVLDNLTIWVAPDVNWRTNGTFILSYTTIYDKVNYNQAGYFVVTDQFARGEGNSITFSNIGAKDVYKVRVWINPSDASSVMQHPFIDEIDVNMIDEPKKVVEWTLDEIVLDGTDKYFLDRSGNNNDGLLTGTAQVVSGLVGNCLDISSNSYVIADSCSNLPTESDDSWTINMYVYHDTAPSNWDVLGGFGSFDFSTNGYTRGFISYNTDYQIRFVGQSGQQVPSGLSNTVVWEVGSWQMVTATFDGQTIKLYKNGKLFSQRSADDFTTQFNSCPARVAIGYSNWSNYIDGKIDEFTIWDGVISQIQINKLASVLPLFVPSYNIKAEASSVYGSNQFARISCDGAGLDDTGFMHSNGGSGEAMWLCSTTDTGADNPTSVDAKAWIQYSFDEIYKLDELWVWNYNQDSSGWDANYRGMRNVNIDYSVDGVIWKNLGSYEFNIATGVANYKHNTEIDFGGVDARFVVITADSTDGNWGNTQGLYGLSEIKFIGKKVLPIIEVSSITATASSQWDTTTSPDRSVNGSGMNTAGFLHDNQSSGNTMWMSAANDSGANNPAGLSGKAWIQYELDGNYKLNDIWIWNYNQSGAWGATERGMRNVSIYYSKDGYSWSEIGEYEIPEASGLADEPHSIEIELNSISCKYILITADTTDCNWGFADSICGLSEVRFYGEEVTAISSDDITAYVSSEANVYSTIEKTFDSSGLDTAGYLHDNSSTALTMWQSDSLDTGENNPAGVDGAAWLLYEFDTVYELYDMWVWNFNQSGSGSVDEGLRDVSIHYSINGSTWQSLGEFEFSKAQGDADYSHDTIVDFHGNEVKYVLITASDTDGNWGATGGIYGLSEIRFFGNASPYFFEGRMSQLVLEDYLSHAITQADFVRPPSVYTFDENKRMVQNIGAKFICRSAVAWDVPHSATNFNMADDDAFYSTIEEYCSKMIEADPDVIVQGTIFETVYSSDESEVATRIAQGYSGAGVEQIPVPAWVFEEFNQTVVIRDFSYLDMIYTDGYGVNHWLPGASIPDMSRLETRMWFYYRARRYIDAGLESLHFGQVQLMSRNDTNHTNWFDVLKRIRRYAKLNARRGFILCDGHAGYGVVENGKLLMDLNLFPLRPKEQCGTPYEAILEYNWIDSIYGKSVGGTTPSGWSCTSLPYNVEFDNSGAYNPGVCGGPNSHWPWGWDEICWFAHCSETYRNLWLNYSIGWLSSNYPIGYVRVPGETTIASDPIGSIWAYKLNTMTNSCSTGFNQEETVKQIWKDKTNLPD